MGNREKSKNKTPVPSSQPPASRIIGIGGLPRSGKDTVAELFIQNGWFGISFGDVVREYARTRHVNEPDPISVANMTETSNWLRNTYGADVILQEALKRYKQLLENGQKYKGLMLWSVRAPVEVDFILKHSGQLIWVEASDEVRHARNIANLREGEQKITLAEFKRQEALQWQPQLGIPKEVQMNVSYVKAHATITIKNNGTNKEAFLKQSKKLIKSIAVE
jgi:dephospho-CoA kinase